MTGTIIITGVGADAAARQAGETDKQVTFRSCVSFTDFSSKINNSQADNGKGLNVVTQMYNLIQYSKNDLNTNIIDSLSFKFKA